MKTKPIQNASFGNSEFVRSKLQDQYNPKLPSLRPSFTISQHRNSVPNANAFVIVSKQQNEMCDRAVQQLKMGSHFVIDWNTKSNFRTTKSNILKKAKTEPTDDTFQFQNYKSHNTDFKLQIEYKRKRLDKLLKIKRKKHYMLTKNQLQEEKNQLLLRSKTDCKKSADRIGSLRSSGLGLAPSKLHSESICVVQQKILKASKLKILKDDLKSKFKQIRMSFQESIHK